MIKAKEISEMQLSAVNRRAAEIAVQRSRLKLKYYDALKVRWFVTKDDRAFCTTRSEIFDAASPHAFVPIKAGVPEIWLRASEEPELVAWAVFHEMVHVPDVENVHHRELLAKARGLKANADHWAAWLYRQACNKSEDKAERFQSAQQGEAILVGAMARKSLAS